MTEGVASGSSTASASSAAILGAACLASGSYPEAAIVAGEGELGMGTGSGERPHAQVRTPALC